MRRRSLFSGLNLEFNFSTGTPSSLGTRMTILPDGKVGIGTESPTGKVTIKNADDANINVFEVKNDNDNVSGGFSQSSAGDGTLFSKKNDGTLSTFFRSNGISYLNGGNVGIGTDSPLNLLSLEGSAPVLSIKDTASYTAYTNGGKIYFQGTDSDGSANRTFGGVLGVSQSSNNGQLRLQTRSSGTLYDRLIINADGAVGIGTATPRGSSSYQGLEISGTSGGVVTFSVNHVEKWNIYGADAVGGVYDRVNTRYNLKWHSDGDVELPTGNLKVANGHGIDFSSTGNGGGTTNSELFHDYEEGSWSPTCEFGSGGTTGMSLGTAIGRYTKIGRVVRCDFTINFSAKGTSTGGLYIASLPFTATDDSHARITGIVPYVANVTSVEGHIMAYGGTPATRVPLYDATNGSTIINQGNIDDDCLLRGVITYNCH